MSNAHLVKGQIETLVPFQATVLEVYSDGSIKIKISETKTEVIPPLYYGGVKDCGIFMHPDVGDTVLCVRVHPGSKGVTQAIAVLAAEGKEKAFAENDFTVPMDSSPYPEVGIGDVRVLSAGGSELGLKGPPLFSDAYMITAQRSGMYASSDPMTTFNTLIANVSQVIDSGSRTISGEVIRSKVSQESLASGEPGASDHAASDIGFELEGYCKISGSKRGLYAGTEAQNSYFLGSPRNPILSEHRIVVNEFSEESCFTGWDFEHTTALSADKKVFDIWAHKQAVDPRTSLNLAPHQLVEIIAGNLINSRGESLDINYGTVEVGDSNNRPIIDQLSYESDRIISRRGVGYHFQLATNSNSEETGGDVENFVCAIDKQGILKLNVPRGSGAGNIPYPTSARFGHISGGIYTEPLFPSQEEGVPVTLRDETGDVILPTTPPSQDMDAASKRFTGVRFSNSTGYFQNFENIGGANSVRVNFTAHHNMYAAAEMLIANTVQKVLVPEKATECPGFVIGTAIGQPFERYLGNLDGKGVLKENALKFMSTVAIKPGQPAMYTGGGTVVGGQNYLSEKNNKNQPYTNSFTVGLDAQGNLTNKVSDKGFTGQKDPGGKSANLNFEGAIDVSIGKDELDRKSLVLDTAGSVIAWFGRDRNGRSLVVQTDGSVAVNIGGRATAEGVDAWREGRLDLRVNVTDKGPVHLKDDWVTDGGDHASDYIISISDAGLVIAGMNPGAPMIIRNDGALSIESTGKLSIGAQSIEMREGNRVPRKTHKAPTSDDQPPPDLQTVQDKITCITDILAKMTED